MAIKKIKAHAFWVTGLTAAFYLAGMVGLHCENLHASLAVSSSAFGATFASIVGVLAKIYIGLYHDLFG